MALWSLALLTYAITRLAGAFVSPGVSPAWTSEARPVAGALQSAYNSRLRGVRIAGVAEDTARWSHIALLAVGLSGLAAGAAHRKSDVKRRKNHSSQKALRVMPVNASTESVLATRPSENLNSVEAALTTFVPKMIDLRNQAQLLRSGELKEVIQTMKELGKTDIRSVFGEVDQLLCALVDAIQNLKESAIQIRRDDLREGFDDQARSVLHSNAADDDFFSNPSSRRRDEIETMMEVHVVGLSHHSAPVDIREKLAVAQDQWNAYAQELVAFSRTSSGHIVSEVAVLSTCNRFELYFASPELEKYPAVECVHAFLRQKSGLSREEIDPYLFTHTGKRAVHHLFEVSSGLDSLVLGEAQILAQVKACHQQCIMKANAEDESVVPGSGGKIIAKLMNAGIRMGKLARSQTNIGRGAVSVSSAAVELMMANAVGDLRKHSANLNVCVVGAGKMTRLLLLALFSKHPDIRLTLVARSVDKARALLEEVAPRGGARADVVSSDKMWDAIGESDVVFASTSSREPIIFPSDLERLKRKLMLIDISVPLNVVPGCGEVPGITSYNVDDLKKIQEANNHAREAEVQKATNLIEEQANSFRIWQASQGAVPYLASLQAMAENIRQLQCEKVSSRLKGLQEKERKVVDNLTRHIIDDLFRPIYYSMKDEEDTNAKKNKIWALQKMFSLEPMYKRRNLLMGEPASRKLNA